MKKLIIALAAGTAALFVASASAAPLNPMTTLVDNGVEKVRMVCDQQGRCWNDRGARRMNMQRESYGYDRPRRHHRYHHRHHHQHDQRSPGIGIHVPGVSIGVGGGR